MYQLLAPTSRPWITDGRYQLHVFFLIIFVHADEDCVATSAEIMTYIAPTHQTLIVSHSIKHIASYAATIIRENKYPDIPELYYIVDQRLLQPANNQQLKTALCHIKISFAGIKVLDHLLQQDALTPPQHRINWLAGNPWLTKDIVMYLYYTHNCREFHPIVMATAFGLPITVSAYCETPCDRPVHADLLTADARGSSDLSWIRKAHFIGRDHMLSAVKRLAATGDLVRDDFTARCDHEYYMNPRATTDEKELILKLHNDPALLELSAYESILRLHKMGTPIPPYPSPSDFVRTVRQLICAGNTFAQIHAILNISTIDEVLITYREYKKAITVLL